MTRPVDLSRAAGLKASGEEGAEIEAGSTSAKSPSTAPATPSLAPPVPPAPPWVIVPLSEEGPPAGFLERPQSVPRAGSNDERFTIESAMARGLALAARPGGRTSPNPRVGAVALDATSGWILAEGFHRAPGEDHAEAALLRDATARGVDLRGSTLVCVMEPCSHRGRTPPCAPLVVAAGFARVVVAMRDPNPLVDGRGLAIVRPAGAEVVEGVLEREARRLNEGFLRWIRTGSPWVHLKVAMLPDGTVYRGSAAPREISGPESRRVVHWWRHLAPAVLVGSGTLRVDDPRLTVRDLPPSAEAEPWQPRRIVLSARLDVPPAAHALRRLPGAPAPLVIGAESAPAGNASALERAGAEVLQVPASREGVNLEAALAAIGSLGITEILVEAGPTLAGALVSAELVDRLSVFVAGAAGAGGPARRGARARRRAAPRKEAAPERAASLGSPRWTTAVSRRWTPPGGLPFTSQGLAEVEEVSVGADRLITGLLKR